MNKPSGFWQEPSLRAYLAERVAEGASNQDLADELDTTIINIPVQLSAMGISRGRETCSYCHAPLVQPARGRRKLFCNNLCSNRAIAAARPDRLFVWQRVEVTCAAEGCSNVFVTTLERQAKGRGRFCGNACKYRTVQQWRRRENRVAATGVGETETEYWSPFGHLKTN